MKVKGESIVLLAVCVAVSFLLAMPGASFAADQDRIRSYQDGGDHLDIPRIQLQLRDRIVDDTGLTAAELSKYEPLMTEALELNGGDAEPVREMFRKSVGEGCVDECLMERLRTRNRTMLQERKQLMEADQEQTRTRERIREQTQEQTGEQSGKQNGEQNQSGGGSGGGKGR